MDVRPFSRNY